MGIMSAVSSAAHTPQELFQPSDIVLDKHDKKTIMIVLNNPKFRAVIEETLASVDAKLDITAFKSDAIVLKCTLDTKDVDFTEKSKHWESLAKNAFESVLSEFCVEEFAPSHISWPEFLEKTKGVSTDACEKCGLEYNDKKKTVVIVGRHGDVKELFEEMDKVFSFHLLFPLKHFNILSAAVIAIYFT